MKDSQVYLKAAERIDAGLDEFSCLAIAKVLGGRHWTYYDLASGYCDAMDLRGQTDFSDMWDLHLSNEKNLQRQREARVWLLLLASAIAESEE